MDGLEYRSLNQLRKYPFTDTSSLVSNTSEVLSNTLFSELLVYRFNPGFFVAAISSIVVSAGSSTLTLTLTLRTVGGSSLGTYVASIPFASCVKDALYTNQDSNFGIKVVFGSGISTFLTNKTLLFSTSTADILDSCCISPPQLVNSIVVANNTTTFKTINATESLDIDAGANMVFAADGISVIPAAGTGLFDPCTGELFIKSVNFVEPDRENNFVVSADSCYQITPQENGLLLENECKPKCTDVQMKAVGTYILRLQDGISDLNVFAKDLADDLLEKIEEYNSGEALTKNDPYSRHSVSKFPTNTIGTYFFSVVVGLFNPSAEEVLLNLAITGGTPVVGTTRLVTKTGTEVLASLTLVNKPIPCISQARLEFVVRTTTLNLTLTGTLGAININQTITAS